MSRRKRSNPVEHAEGYTDAGASTPGPTPEQEGAVRAAMDETIAERRRRSDTARARSNLAKATATKPAGPVAEAVKGAARLFGMGPADEALKKSDR